ncbi:Uncharacterized protein family UPF0114 [Macleaya cordata]|uniref:Uncharacterized protein family UPF0114 n=1 Tax=Macleaya cordata TaxID=56857 RepID=A0A200R7A9_MACCD|nr:Uncharacterized protein family UPF0114 [Macleaya cordata]
MAVTGRLLRVSRPLRLSLYSSSLNSNGSSSLRSLNKAGETREKGISLNGEMKSTMVVKAVVSSETVVSTEPQTKSRDDLGSLVAAVADAVLRISRFAVKRKSWTQQAQMIIEKGVIDCRFFSLFAVAGSLLGSVLCFVEGCFFILESYFEYFHAISEKSDQGHVMQLLIEAIDMFLLGSAMLIFGMGLYVLFMGSRNMNRGHRVLLPGSNLFGLFHLKGPPACIGMNSMSQAKSKIGHAVLMILQVGVLEKFKNVPLVTGFDLACFAGAILISSACVFLLSRLSTGGSHESGR